MDVVADVEVGVLDGLDFAPVCRAFVHGDDMPEAVWYRVLGCGCVMLQCDGCKAHDDFVQVVRGGGARCVSCNVVTVVVLLKRL